MLWNAIHLTRENFSRREVLSLTDAWLARSKEGLIDVQLGGERCADMLNAFTLHGCLLEKLNPHCNRFRSLTAVCHKEALEALPLTEMTALRDLHLNRTEVYWPWSGTAYVDLSRPLPHLRTLFLRDVFPWSLDSQAQLAYLDLNHISLHDACTLLALLPNLESFNVWLDGKEDDRYSMIPLTTRKELLKLRVLQLHICHAESRAIFEGFAAPNLEELSFELPQPHFDVPSSSVKPSCWSAHCDFLFSGGLQTLRLQKLIIALLCRETGVRDPEPVDLHVLEILRASPALRELSLSEVFVDRCALEALVWDLDEKAEPEIARRKRLVPQLETFSLDACLGFADADIIPVLRSRKHILRKVELSHCSGMCAENRKEIEEMGIATMNLSYTDGF